jgi:hypothetical protein
MALETINSKCHFADLVGNQPRFVLSWDSYHLRGQRTGMRSYTLFHKLVSDFRIILIRHIHTTAIFLVLLYISSIPQFRTLIVQHVSSYCNSSSGTFIKQFTRLRVASQYALHWVCSNCKIHLL